MYILFLLNLLDYWYYFLAYSHTVHFTKNLHRGGDNDGSYDVHADAIDDADGGGGGLIFLPCFP